MLTTQEIKQLSQTSALRTWLSLAFDWGFIMALLALAVAVPHPLVLFFCLILMARQQLALAIMMHDASHRRLFKSAKLNDYVAQIFLASPLFFSVFGYRRLHLKHHRDPLVADDPDLSLTGGYPISRKSLVRKLARDLFGVSYFKFIKYFFHMTTKGKKTKTERSSADTESSQKPVMSLREVIFWHLAVNGMILAGLWMAGHPWLYLLLWYLPMITVLQFLLRIRGITEHAGYKPNEDQRFNTRTVLPSWQTFLFAPHQVNYHIEHHIYTGIPCFNLPQAHQLMRARGVLPEENLFKNYNEVLQDLVV